MDHEIRQRYGTLRQGYPPGEPVTVLQIGDEQTALATGAGDRADAVLVLAIGAKRTAADFFKHARKMVAGHATLLTTDATIRDIALIAGVPAQGGMVLPVEAVERVFDLLAAFSLGRPASSAGIPADPAFAATLLILRELMHHLQFASICVVSGATKSPS